jgi:hypothetical protein
MKNFRDYLKESELAADNPITGDVFAVNIREECLVESVVLEHAEDGIVIAADDRMLEIFESYGISLEDVCMECGLTECGCVHETLDDSVEVEYAEEEPVDDPGEYGEEGDMAKNELQTIIRAARKLSGMLDNNDDMPEWTQKKITKAADYVDTAADYISSQKERGIMEQPEDSPVARAVLHRIMMQHPGVLATHGPKKVMDAVDELAYHVGDVEEIGTSDVSGWTRDVIRMLAELPDEPMNVGDALDESDVEEDISRRGLLKGVAGLAGGLGVVGVANQLGQTRNLDSENVTTVNGERYTLGSPSLGAKLDGKTSAGKYKLVKDDKGNMVYIWNDVKTYGGPTRFVRKFIPVDQVNEQGVAEAEIDDTWMNDRHREFYKRNPHFKRNDRERVEVGRGTQLATRVEPSVKPAQVQKKPATRFGMDEAEYQGRDVPLGKPMRGDVKKFKVYVRDPKTGNVKKVNFGDPNMQIKKSNPARRKSFRARHNCDTAKDRTTARYWSCRKW